MFKIMIIEDDPTMREMIAEALGKWKFESESVLDFEQISERFAVYQPELILLDINLPIYDGFYWCQRIRALSKVPIIFISSRDTAMDKIMAMNMGGDDFITKPIDLDVLTAKINALLRRTYSYRTRVPHVLEFHGALLQLTANTLMYHDRSIELTKNEFRMMHTLMKHAESIVSRDQIMRDLWENESFVDDNTLTVNMVRLRRKLDMLGMKDWIKTKKGQGYQLQ
ncbi:response regulator transcription factor [Sporolactobacillus shoreicorticis]|uniref:Response regulator transcription factor n=1 Tax=Sporolactobacillus shoreicorticis TaxID=1923877 RepID=A0ABW5S590_9BACL|nr:response regulator transcription factor [Sporolactobacillus shoreicorticis]MCO7126236.1 response regulator transcription factor [Sporolactobacillus shoreicorticis]